MPPTPTVRYLADDSVDPGLDLELRDLLATCFTNPADHVFRQRRYLHERAAYRWMVRSSDGKLIAHLAVHEKHIQAGTDTHRVAGIAEVCVHPDARGGGMVKRLLAEAHAWLTARDYMFAVLFGLPEVYSSSGYVVRNDVLMDGESGRHRTTVMVRPLTDTPWPTDEVYLPGKAF